MPNSPALSLRFGVEIDDISVAQFTGCSGLGGEYEVVPWKEGGDNGMVIQLPGRLSFPNVKLTRAVDSDSGALAAWFASHQHGPSRKRAVIKVYDANYGEGDPIATWTLDGAWPVRYTGPTLSVNQEGEAVAVETLELAHHGYVK